MTLGLAWSALSSRPVATLPALLGLVTAVPTLGHLATDPHSRLGTAIGIGVIVFLCAPLFVGSWWLLTGSFTRSERQRVLSWAVVGAVPITLLASVIVFYEQSHGVTLAHPLIVVGWVAGVGAIGGFLTGVYDVRNERRRERVEQTSTRLRALIGASPVAIVAIDRDGKVLEWSQAAEDIFGWSEAEIVGEQYPLVPDHKEAEFQSHLQRVNAGEVLDGVETQRLRKDGFPVDVSIWSAPVEREGIVAEHMIAIADITERKERERELRLLQRAIEQAEDAILISNREGVIEYVNDAFVDLFGYERSEVIGETPSILKSEEHGETFYQDLWSTITDGEVFQAEVTNRCADGELCDVELTIAPVETDGEVTHYVAIERDVTDRKHAEQRLEVLNRVLRHDVRNAVAVIKGNAARLEDGVTAEGELALQSIIGRADQLHSAVEKARTVEQALDARETTPVNLSSLLDAQQETFTEQYPDSSIAVDVPDDVWVSGNHTLEAAVWEALDNAVSHGEGPATVRVEATVDDDQVELQVLDDGPGIPSHEQQVLAQGQESALHHGSGLGLWLMKWVATGLGGDVAVAERDAGGTAVTFTLRRDTPSDENQPFQTTPSHRTEDAATTDD